jgi:hypothetical protein
MSPRRKSWVKACGIAVAIHTALFLGLFLASKLLHLEIPDFSPFTIIACILMVADFPVVILGAFLDSQHLVTPEINAILLIVLGALWWIFIVSLLSCHRYGKASPKEKHP